MDILANENIKAMFRNPDGSQRVFGRAQAITEIKNVTW